MVKEEEGGLRIPESGAWCERFVRVQRAVRAYCVANAICAGCRGCRGCRARWMLMLVLDDLIG